MKQKRTNNLNQYNPLLGHFECSQLVLRTLTYTESARDIDSQHIKLENEPYDTDFHTVMDQFAQSVPSQDHLL